MLFELRARFFARAKTPEKNENDDCIIGYANDCVGWVSALDADWERFAIAPADLEREIAAATAAIAKNESMYLQQWHPKNQN